MVRGCEACGCTIRQCIQKCFASRVVHVNEIYVINDLCTRLLSSSPNRRCPTIRSANNTSARSPAIRATAAASDSPTATIN